MTPRFAMRCSSASSFVAEPALQRLAADQAADAERGARGEHRADGRASEAEHGTERDDGRADQRQDRHGDDARDDETDEHERHAPRAAGQATSMPTPTRRRCRPCRDRSARSRTAATATSAAAPSSASPHFRRPRIAHARGLRDELVRRHDALGIAELHDEVDAGRFVALDRLDAAEGRRARRAAPRREPRMPRAVRRAEHGHARQRLERRRPARRKSSAAATLFSSLPQCSAIKRLRTDAIARRCAAFVGLDGEVALGVEAHGAVVQVRRADAQERVVDDEHLRVHVDRQRAVGGDVRGLGVRGAVAARERCDELNAARRATGPRTRP